jgi:hypothetical protein
MKYKIILKTSSKHKNRIENCLNTWLVSQDYICLTDNILGGVGEEFSGSKRTDYSSNEEKTVNFINNGAEHYKNYDWLVFIDDDAIINTLGLKYILPYLNKDFVYGLSMLGAWPKDQTLNFPSGGASYFISPKLIMSMPPMPIRGHGQEDVSMGEWLRENNKQITNSYEINGKKLKLYLNGWYPFSDMSQKSCDLIDDISADKNLFLRKHFTHHYIKESCLMNYIYNVFKNWTPQNIEECYDH